MEELLRAVEEYAALHTVPVIGRDSAVLLAEAVAERQPRAILEIGTAVGYSTLVMAEKMGPGARITTIEVDAERAEAARRFIARAGCQDRVEILIGDAAVLLPRLPDTYDFVFIDAAKAHYLSYLAKIIARLRPGATIFADNIHFYGLVTADRAPRRMRTIVKRMRAYLDFVTGDPRFATTLHEVGDGVAISRYRGDA